MNSFPVPWREENGALLETSFQQWPLHSRGKVRDIYDLEENLLFVSTDRLSVFDYILDTGIPHRGRVLTQLSLFWFDRLSHLVSHHIADVDPASILAEIPGDTSPLMGRIMVGKKADPIPVECVVRGYLAGYAWREYNKGGEVSGIKFPAGLVESDLLESPVFTPTTKAKSGHDEPITFEDTCGIVGEQTAEALRELSFSLFEFASKFLDDKGIIISDTKFEFGFLDGEIVLIDEVFTPDSSRFWLKADYEPGRPQQSYDKEIARSHYLNSSWDRVSAPPPLPPEVAAHTRDRYLEIFEMITGEPCALPEEEGAEV